MNRPSVPHDRDLGEYLCGNRRHAYLPETQLSPQRSSALSELRTAVMFDDVVHGDVMHTLRQYATRTLLVWYFQVLRHGWRYAVFPYNVIRAPSPFRQSTKTMRAGPA